MSPTAPHGADDDADATAPLPRIEDDVATTRELPAYQDPGPQDPVHHEPAPGAPYRAAVPPYAPTPAFAPEPGVSPTRPPRNPLVAVGWVVAILLALVLVVLVVGYLTRGGGGDGASPLPSTPVTMSSSASPSASVTPTPSPRPSPSPSPTPTMTAAPTTPAGGAASFVAWDAPATASCPNSSDVVDVTITWISAGAVKAWIGVATTNAKAEPYDEVPTSGSYTLGFPCSNASQLYTVTLEDPLGNLTHKTADIASGAP